MRKNFLFGCLIGATLGAVYQHLVGQRHQEPIIDAQAKYYEHGRRDGYNKAIDVLEDSAFADAAPHLIEDWIDKH